MTPKTTAPTIYRADDRGVTDIGWLDSRHSFSFGRYFHPDRIGYRSLRVINDDVVAPGRGFGEHGHDNMEILSWVLEGQLAHTDSEDHQGVIRPGDLQVMSAGRGIRHSEMNGSDSDPVHFLQVWIEPASRDTEPGYAQKHFDSAGRQNQWQLVASPDGDRDSMVIGQDARLAIAQLDANQSLSIDVQQGRYAYLHVASGTVTVDDHTLGAGDAISTAGPVSLSIEGERAAELLAFDLA